MVVVGTDAHKYSHTFGYRWAVRQRRGRRGRRVWARMAGPGGTDCSSAPVVPVGCSPTAGPAGPAGLGANGGTGGNGLLFGAGWIAGQAVDRASATSETVAIRRQVTRLITPGRQPVDRRPGRGSGQCHIGNRRNPSPSDQVDHPRAATLPTVLVHRTARSRMRCKTPVPLREISVARQRTTAYLQSWCIAPRGPGCVARPRCRCGKSQWLGNAQLASAVQVRRRRAPRWSAAEWGHQPQISVQCVGKFGGQCGTGQAETRAALECSRVGASATNIRSVRG